jgi:hypothetical protein
MVDDPLLTLEHELIRAAERQVAMAEPGARRLQLRRHISGGLAVAMAVIPVLVVGGAVIALRSGGRSLASAGQPGGSPFAAILGVVRRPQTAADRPAWLVRFAPRAFHRQYPRATFQPGLMRRVDVPLAGGGPGQSLPIELVFARGIERSPGERLQLVAPAIAGGLAPRTPIFYAPALGVTAAEVADRGLYEVVYTNIRTGSEAIDIVPDGVAAVSLSVPGQRPIRSAVHDNVAGFLVPGERFAISNAGVARTITWYGQDGRVLRTIGPAPSRDQLHALEALLPVLRRRQTAADRPSALVGLLTARAPEALYGAPMQRLMRRAAVTPWGARVYVVPVVPPASPRVLPGLSRLGGLLFDERSAPNAGLFFRIGDQFGCCATPAMLAAGDVVVQSPLHSGSPGLPGRELRILAIVPGGVARVVFSCGPGYNLTARVRGDVAAVQSRRVGFDLGSMTMTWYNRAGGVTLTKFVG